MNPKYKIIYNDTSTASCKKNKHDIIDKRIIKKEWNELVHSIIEKRKNYVNKIVHKYNTNLLNNKFLFDHNELIKAWISNKMYSNNELSFNNTLKYLFNHIYFGIYVKIYDNKLALFVPFYKKEYKNNWNNIIKYDKNEVKDWDKKNHLEFEPDPTKWRAFSCDIQTYKKRHVHMINMPAIHHMFQTVTQKKKLSDCEFFINPYDFPILHKDNIEPYDYLFEKPKQLNYSKNYLPILSMCKSAQYLDLLIPTVDDWEIVTKNTYAVLCRDIYKNSIIETDWNKKVSTLVMRGSSTQCGVDSTTSSRIHIHNLSKEWEKDNRYNENNPIDGIKYLDAGITRYWFDYIKTKNDKRIYNIPPDETVNSLSLTEQSKHKYIINIDGTVTAFRISFELSFNSLILKTESKYFTLFSSYMKPYIDYIPIKDNLSNLGDTITWCKQHDMECEQIANNSKQLYDKHVNMETILDYLDILINSINKN